jgi:AcrR family transcriptional regulator
MARNPTPKGKATAPSNRLRDYGSDVPRAEELAPEPAAVGPPAGGRRERRRREIRDLIYETAVELFLEQGYERTTMDEIAERADVARTTVFNHYPRKFEFLNEWGARRRAQVADALSRSHLDDKPIDVVLASYMRLMAQLNVEHRAETKELMPAALAFSLSNSPMASTFASYIERGQKRGEIRGGVDPAQAGEMLVATYFATIIRWGDHDPPAFDLTEALTNSARLLLHGIEVDRDDRK